MIVYRVRSSRGGNPRGGELILFLRKKSMQKTARGKSSESSSPWTPNFKRPKGCDPLESGEGNGERREDYAIFRRTHVKYRYLLIWEV